MPSVLFRPPGNQAQITAGASILEAALAAGAGLGHECGGQGRCTTCHVIVEAGRQCLSPVSEAEAMKLSAVRGVTAMSRLACQARATGEDRIIVRIP